MDEKWIAGTTLLELIARMFDALQTKNISTAEAAALVRGFGREAREARKAMKDAAAASHARARLIGQARREHAWRLRQDGLKFKDIGARLGVSMARASSLESHFDRILRHATARARAGYVDDEPLGI